MCSDKDIRLWFLIDIWKNKSKFFKRDWKSSEEDFGGMRTDYSDTHKIVRR